MADNKKRKFSLYGFFNPDNGKGVKKTTDTHPRTFSYFFPFAWRNIGTIFTMNMFLVLINFPILVFLFGLTGNTDRHVISAAGGLFGPVWGITELRGISPAAMALRGIFCATEMKSVATPLTIVLRCFGLLTLFTFGIANVGTAYIFRNLVKGEPLFVWHDFWYAVKRNWKQALPCGIIDALLHVFMIFDLLYYREAGNAIILGVMVAVCGMFIMMRFYTYIMMVTFDLSLFKLLKNSFIFMFVGIKRNIVGLLGVLLAGGLNVYLLLLGIYNGGLFLPIAVILPMVITFALLEFIGIYAAYPVMYDVMMKPILDSTEKPEEPQEEPIFKDRG